MLASTAQLALCMTPVKKKINGTVGIFLSAVREAYRPFAQTDGGQTEILRNQDIPAPNMIGDKQIDGLVRTVDLDHLDPFLPLQPVVERSHHKHVNRILRGRPDDLGLNRTRIRIHNNLKG